MRWKLPLEGKKDEQGATWLSSTKGTILRDGSQRGGGDKAACQAVTEG